MSLDYLVHKTSIANARALARLPMPRTIQITKSGDDSVSSPVECTGRKERSLERPGVASLYSYTAVRRSMQSVERGFEVYLRAYAPVLWTIIRSVHGAGRSVSQILLSCCHLRRPIAATLGGHEQHGWVDIEAPLPLQNSDDG